MKNLISLIFICCSFYAFGQINQTNIQNTFQELMEPVLEQGSQSSSLNGVPFLRLDSLVSLYTGNQTGQKDRLTVYSYDAQTNLITSRLGFEKDPINYNWAILDQSDWKYDVNNNEIEESNLFSWDSTVNLFTQGVKSETTLLYNQVTKQEYFNLTPYQSWEYSAKRVYFYNSFGKISEIELYSYIQGSWQLSSKVEYYFNGNNDPVEIISRQYMAPGVWLNIYKFDISYHSPEIVSEFKFYTWDSNWSPQFRQDNTFDSALNLTQQTLYTWDDVLTSWLLDTRYTITYDLSYPHEDLIVPFDKIVCRHQLLTYIRETYDQATSQWHIDIESTYYWTNLLTSGLEDDFTSEQVTAYPNPTSDVLYFKLPKINEPTTIELFNVQGQRIFNGTLRNNRLVLGQLAAGIYSYRVQQNGKFHSGKVIVE